MIEENTIGLSHDYIIHPGETLMDVLEERNMTQKELAIRSGVSEKHISTVISGQKNISAEFAKKLEYALGIDAIFWMNLQSNYDKDIIKFEEIHNISEDELSIVNNIKDILVDYKKEKFIHSNLSKADEVLELRHLFNISNLRDIPKLSHVGAYRLNNVNGSANQYMMFAWEKYCELIDNKDDTYRELNIDKLRDSIPSIKSIMFHETKDIIKDLTDVFANCGIRFYLMKNYKGAPVQGYIRHNNFGGISLYMTVRGKYADIFWFSLFHEIAHIINGDAKNSFIDYDEMPEVVENKANKTASNYIISDKSYDDFVLKRDFTIDSIRRLANENNVQIFMCLGRLMKDKYIEWNKYSAYRTRYQL
jgi:HTH-type transcriptional regulator / antitoxin HigA